MGASRAPIRDAAPAATPNAVVSVDISSAWDGEPTTVQELQQRYETLMECPARNANVQLKLVPAVEKGATEPKMISPKQQHKLFLVGDLVAMDLNKTPYPQKRTLSSVYRNLCLPEPQVAANQVTLTPADFQIAHDRAAFLAGAKVQKLLEGGGRGAGGYQS